MFLSEEQSLVLSGSLPQAPNVYPLERSQPKTYIIPGIMKKITQKTGQDGREEEGESI